MLMNLHPHFLVQLSYRELHPDGTVVRAMDDVAWGWVELATVRRVHRLQSTVRCFLQRTLRRVHGARGRPSVRTPLPLRAVGATVRLFF